MHPPTYPLLTHQTTSRYYYNVRRGTTLPTIRSPFLSSTRHTETKKHENEITRKMHSCTRWSRTEEEFEVRRLVSGRDKSSSVAA